MKKIVLLTLFACLQISTHCYSQVQTSVSLRANHDSLRTVLDEITNPMDYSYFMNDTLLRNSKPVTIVLRHVKLEDALGAILRPQGFDYSITNKSIFIFEKGTKPQANSQPKKVDVKGRVVDENGASMVGANVADKNVQSVGETNKEGVFELKDIVEGTLLTVSYTGYKNKEFRAGPRIINITLNPAINVLDQAKIIAYGVTTKRLATGNITTVDGKDIERQPVDDPLLALEGRVPGLFVTPANGLAGGGITVRIQGQNSISNGNDPLYVIDGVPYPSQLLSTSIGSVLGSSGLGGASGNPMAFLNPSDIESITVLKDADATAIYGSRAANGAILFTTKKGKAGRTKLTINAQEGIGNETRRLHLLNTTQYMEMRHEALRNDGITAPGPQDFDINGVWDTTRYTDWQKKLIGGTTQYTDIYGSVSGGDKQAQYIVAGTYHRQTAVFPGGFAEVKGSGYLNLNTVSVNQRLTMQVMVNFLFDDNRLPQVDLTSQALTLAPDAPSLFQPNGKLNWELQSSGASTWQNPLSYWYKTYQQKTKNLLSHTAFKYQILQGLDGKLGMGYSSLSADEFSGNGLEGLSPGSQSVNGRSAWYSNNSIESWIIEPQLDFHRQLNIGNVEALAGATVQQQINNGIVFYGYDFATDALLADMHSAAYLIVPASVQNIYRYTGIFGRLTYDWSKKYLLNLVIRRDGSSRFGPVNRFHDFASVGAGWIFSQEKFCQNLIPWLSLGKLRGSYGTTGSDQIGDYRYMDLYSTLGAGVPYQGIAALTVTSLPNPNLQWEETRKLQVGLDLGFLRDRILLEVNYVRNRSSDELIQLAVPVITGAQTFAQNVSATVQNKSMEVELVTKNFKKKDFSWSTSFNLTVPANKLIRYFGISPLPANLIIGKPLGISRAFEAHGVDPATGIYRFLDNHGDLTLSPSPDTDLVAEVNTNFPRFYGGIGNNIRYKGWELDLFVQFVEGEAGNNWLGQEPGPGSSFTNQPKSVLSRWQKPGDVASIERFNSNFMLSSSFSDAVNSTASFSRTVYIRFKNVSLTWNAPGRLARKLGVNDLKFSIHAQNLFTISRFRGFDPETGNEALPPLRMLTFGLQLEL